MEKGKQSVNVIDLFCGAGGMSLGLKQAGFNIIAAIIGSYKDKYSFLSALNSTCILIFVFISSSSFPFSSK